MREQIPNKIKQDRHKHLMTKQALISQAKLQQKIGTVQDVLVEKKKGKHYIGRLSTQAPEVDGIVYVNASPRLGEIQKVKITASSSYDLVGDAIEGN